MASPPDALLLPGKMNDGASFLIETAVALSLATNQNEVARRLAAAAVEYFCDACFMHVIEEDGVALVGSDDSSGVSAALAAESCFKNAYDDIVQEALRTQKPARYDRDSTGRSGVERNAAEALQAVGARSLIVVPLAVGTTSMGTLTFVEAHRPNAFGEEDVAIASAAGHHVSLAAGKYSIARTTTLYRSKVSFRCEHERRVTLVTRSITDSPNTT